MLLDWVVPKKENLWVIASHSGMVGNARFLAENILESHAGIEVYFYSFYAGREQAETEAYFTGKYRHRFKLVKKRNLEALLAALRSGHIFISHDIIRDVGFPLTNLKGRRAVINLWHGIAMKKQWLVKKYPVRASHREKARQFSKVIASSAADALAKAATFHKTLDDIWLTGNPRNDILMGKEMPGDLRQQEERLRSELKGRSLVLYAPTWRSYARSFEPFPTGCLENLAGILSERNCVLGLRLHEKDEASFKELYSAGSCLNLGTKRYPETQLLLRNTAILVTDYSSIWLDFLLTGKPVVAYWPDLKSYSEHRGFLWDLEELFPGPKATSCPELAAALRQLISHQGQQGLQPGYRFVKKLFHQYTDGKCAERVVSNAIIL